MDRGAVPAACGVGRVPSVVRRLLLRADRAATPEAAEAYLRGKGWNPGAYEGMINGRYSFVCASSNRCRGSLVLEREWGEVVIESY